MRRRTLRTARVLLSLALVFLAACSQKLIPPTRHRPPETQLTYAPLETGTTSYRVHVYWYGYDNDGEVVGFRFAIDSDTTKPEIAWRFTTAHDSTFTFAVAPGDTIGAHVFWIAAQDNDGGVDLTPAKRRITIETEPPVATITSGPMNGAILGTTLPFSWTGTDPDGSPNGMPAPVDSFEYILFRLGSSAEAGHPPIPSNWTRQQYVDLLNQAGGPSLPAPYDDWKWVGTRARSHEFAGVEPGSYFFALRAVDGAGARDAKLELVRNIRYFQAVSGLPATSYSYSPILYVTSNDLLLNPYSPLANQGPEDLVRKPIEYLEGDMAPFSWYAEPGVDGTRIAGYAFAIDDTTVSTWTSPDLKQVGVTLPRALAPGAHTLYVRAIDEKGRFTLVVVPLRVVHAAFRDPTQPASFLYVDDFAAPPGTWSAAARGAPNWAPDSTEDAWWSRVVLNPIAQEFGMTYVQWDAVYLGYVHYGDRREPPTLDELAKHRVVIWSADLNSTLASPSALWSTIVGGRYSELGEYLRGGGTLIVTGFQLASQTASPPTAPYTNYNRGMCAMDPGTIAYRLSYFPREYMGLDGARASNDALRSAGARDFVGAPVTAPGSALGFQTAEVDTGAAETGAKWNPYAFPGTDPNLSLAPGLPKVEGWRLADLFGCVDPSSYRLENPGAPIAVPLFTYHGVNEWVAQDGAPSPREGLVVGVATQAHDDGKGDGSLLVGRMVFLGFPIYYAKDAQAYSIIRAAFAYVNASPTLSGGTP
ncbi:MAG: hypothetical protein ACM3PF_14900 [Bacteroidota bacterium]